MPDMHDVLRDDQLIEALSHRLDLDDAEPVVKDLAGLVAFVDATALPPLNDDVETWNAVSAERDHRYAVRSLTVAAALVVALSTSGVSAAVTGDPLFPARQVLERITQVERDLHDDTTKPYGLDTISEDPGSGVDMQEPASSITAWSDGSAEFGVLESPTPDKSSRGGSKSASADAENLGANSDASAGTASSSQTDEPAETVEVDSSAPSDTEVTGSADVDGGSISGPGDDSATSGSGDDDSATSGSGDDDTTAGTQDPPGGGDQDGQTPTDGQDGQTPTDGQDGQASGGGDQTGGGDSSSPADGSNSGDEPFPADDGATDPADGKTDGTVDGATDGEDTSDGSVTDGDSSDDSLADGLYEVGEDSTSEDSTTADGAGVEDDDAAAGTEDIDADATDGTT